MMRSICARNSFFFVRTCASSSLSADRLICLSIRIVYHILTIFALCGIALEKILGFNTVSALFPFYANNSRSRTEAQKISIKIINELMKCKPPRIRIYLAHIVSEAAINMSSSFEKRDKSSRNLYSSDFSKILIEPLAKAIELINSAYTSLLDLS